MKRHLETVSEIQEVGIWIRVSTEDQARGESPDQHERRARAYAEAKGWRVLELPQAFQKWLNGYVVLNGNCRIQAPAFSRFFQLRSEEGRGYKERVQ